MKRREPFCADAGARRAFARWARFLEGECSLVLSPPDEVLVGALARAEARLEMLSSAVTKAKDPGEQARFVGLEIQAQRAFLSALEATDRALGPRVAVADAASEVTDCSAAAVARGRIRSVAGQRILNALSAGARMTKPELLKASGGDKGLFLRALSELEEEGLVVREGQGHRGRPYRFRRAG